MVLPRRSLIRDPTADYPALVSRLVVVLPLQPLTVGDGFSLSDWPLHVTVAPTFVVTADLNAVTAALSAPSCGRSGRCASRWVGMVVAAHFRIDREAAEIGAVSWLQKPFDLARLDEETKAFCERD